VDVYALLCLVGAVSCTFVAKDEQFCITFGKSQIISDYCSIHSDFILQKEAAITWHMKKWCMKKITTMLTSNHLTIS